MSRWIAVEDHAPDERMLIICCVWPNHRFYPVAVRHGTFHPNAKGKKCWRDGAGTKIVFTHWQKLMEPPK